MHVFIPLNRVGKTPKFIKSAIPACHQADTIQNLKSTGRYVLCVAMLQGRANFFMDDNQT
jgi:hypothetical protein